jgi:integral membrane protein
VQHVSGSATGTRRPVHSDYRGALLRYRIMAYATGVALITACALLILQKVVDVKGIATVTGLSWVAHGWLFLIYAVATLHLGIKLRWHLIRIGLIVLCGTVPFFSFVAERNTMRLVRRRAQAQERTSGR